MKPPITINTPTPLELYEKITSKYGPLPPEVNSFRPTAVMSTIVLSFIFIIIPIASLIDEKTSSIIYYFVVPIGLMIIFNTYNEFFKQRGTRDAEINLRKNTKNKFTLMQSWYEKEEPLHRNYTKQGNKFVYPSDWFNRKEYIEARDNACYLCGKISTNQQTYSSMSYKKRVAGIKPKDINKYHHIHHIVPISKGGTHTLSNLIFLCGKCHENQHNHMKRLK